jgi:hypothetical protein
LITALRHWPEHRARLRDGDLAYAVAFAHKVRRFYPFVRGLAVRDLPWCEEHIPAVVSCRLRSPTRGSRVVPVTFRHLLLGRW